VVAGVRFTHFILFFRRKVVFWELRLSVLAMVSLRGLVTNLANIHEPEKIQNEFS